MTSSEGAVGRSRGEAASEDLISLGEGGKALSRFDTFGVGVLPLERLREGPFPRSSRLVFVETEGLRPSSRSIYRMSIIYHSGNLRVGTWKGSLRTAAVFVP